MITSSDVKSHKRQTSIGLGIVTDLDFMQPPVQTVNTSKNNVFFDTTSSLNNQMKPPPSLGSVSRISSETMEHPVGRPTFADRIRSIVLANRKSAAITPIERSKSKSCNSRRQEAAATAAAAIATSKSTVVPSYPEEEIVPLPSPSQSSLHRTNTFTKHPVVTPDDGCHTPPRPPPLSAIPIISLSPSFSPNKTNIIPPLSMVPMLGDIDEDACNNITREFKFPSPIPNDEVNQLLGKHIWKFRIQELLGVGAFSKVFLAQNLQEGGLVAVKMINKERMYQDLRMKSSIEREVGVLKFLDHPQIVQLEATMETEQHLCIVLEYVQGGELFNFVQHMHNDIHQVGIQSNIDEILIKRLALELIQVVLWLHDHNIVHRDLKLENVLVYFDEDTGQPHIKVTDFGLARIVNPEEPMLTTRCGSEEYAAPEIVQSLDYDGRLTDTWSIGIIIYALLVGYLPFSYDVNKGEKISHLFHRIVMAQVKWPVNDNISTEAQEVVARILVRQPDKRARLSRVQSMPWFSMQTT